MPFVRLGAVYVAAFSFKAAETTASAAARLLLTAPAGLECFKGSEGLLGIEKVSCRVYQG